MAAKLQIKPEVYLPLDQVADLVQTFRESDEDIIHSFDAIDVETAAASFKKDEDAIKMLIRDELTFEKLNGVVKDSLVRCVLKFSRERYDPRDEQFSRACGAKDGSRGFLADPSADGSAPGEEDCFE